MLCDFIDHLGWKRALTSSPAVGGLEFSGRRGCVFSHLHVFYFCIASQFNSLTYLCLEYHYMAGRKCPDHEKPILNYS